MEFYLRTTNLFDNITTLNIAGVLYGGIVILFQSCSSDLCVNCLACVGIGERGRHYERSALSLYMCIYIFNL